MNSSILTTYVNDNRDFRFIESRPGITMVLLPDTPKYTIVAVSNDFVATSGRGREEVIGKSHFEIFPENIADPSAGAHSLLHSFNYTLQQKTSHSLPITRYDIPDGKGGFMVKYWRIINAPIFNENGDVEYVIHTSEDVTEQIKAGEKEQEHQDLVVAYNKIEESQTALKQSETKYRSLFESMDQGYCTLEILFEGDRCVDYRYLETNPAFERHLGLSGAEGRTIREIAPDIEPKWFDFYGGVALTGNPIRIEEESKAFNKWFEVYAIRVGNPEERKVGVYFTDITERKTTEGELQNYKELLQKVYDSAPNSIAVMRTLFDEKGRVEDFAILMFNAFTRNVVGPIDYIGERYSEVFPTVKENGVLDQFKDVATTGVTATFERQYEGEGMNHWFRFTVVKHDELLVVTTEDITEQKTVLKKTEEIVAQRTQELAQANQSLTIINQELARSNQNLEEFAYAASHDLKEPIRKIHFFMDRLKHRLAPKLEEEDRRYFERMELGAKRMATLTDDLLLYSHVSRGFSTVELVDLNQILSFVSDDLELYIEEKGANIRIDPLPAIQGHPRQLQQLFDNLVANALKYSRPDTAPEITITTKVIKGADTALHLNGEEGNRAFHLIEVRDNGIGFDQADADRIFNVFTRLHGNSEYKGSGVGLSIVRKVAENHKGYIWAESTSGIGATFKVLLRAD